MELKKLHAHVDDNGNEITYEGFIEKNISIIFKGSNNRLVVDSSAKISFLKVGFYCNNASVKIGAHGAINVELQMGEDCSISIGDQCYFTAKSYMSVAEGTKINIGNDCMIASGVTFRTNDSHPIFHVGTGNRVNVSKDILIGDHVWLGEKVTIQKGAVVGNGSVIGMSSLVTSRITNNCIAVGVPAKVIKRDIAWESPHLVYTEPYYKPNASCVRKSKYWNESNE